MSTCNQDPAASAKMYLLKLLNRRPYFRLQLQSKLRIKQIPDATIQIVLNELTAAGLLNDEELAEQFLIRQMQKGLRLDLARRKLFALAGSTFPTLRLPDMSREAAEGRAARKAPEKRRAFLARKGHFTSEGTS